MSTSQLTSRTTPLTFSSRPLHLPYLLMYNACLSLIVITALEIKPFVLPFPPPHSFRLTGSIDRPAFIKNILDSQLILNPPSSLEDLLSCYNSTLSHLLNIHAPLIAEQSSHAEDPHTPHTSKPLKPFAGTSSTSTSAPSTRT